MPSTVNHDRRRAALENVTKPPPTEKRGRSILARLLAPMRSRPDEDMRKSLPAHFWQKACFGLPSTDSRVPVDINSMQNGLNCLREELIGQAKFPEPLRLLDICAISMSLKLSLSVLAIALSLDLFCKRDLQRMRIRTDFLLVPVLANELARAQ